MSISKYSLVISVSIALMVSLVCTNYTNAQKKKRQSQRPSISLAKIYNDIVGKSVEEVPSSETGSGLIEWTFASNQPREIKILERKFTGDIAYVTIKMYTQNSSAYNLLASLRGNLRLHYERIAGDWYLTKIENLTFKYTTYTPNNSSNRQDFYNQNNTTNNQTIITKPAPTVYQLVNGAFTIGASQHRYYRFVVSNRATISGRFRAQGGGRNDVEVFILNEDGYENFKNGHSVPTFYNSGRATVSNIAANLGAGTYYLVFNNGFSILSNKAIEAYVEVKYE